MRIKQMALVASLGALAACGGETTSTGSTGGSTGGNNKCTVANAVDCTCAKDSDCPTSAGYTCDIDLSKKCIFQCLTADDCKGDNAPAATKTLCTGSALGCACEIDPATTLAACVTKVCATDTDCGTGNVCENGACKTNPTPAGVSACKVFPEVVLMHVGADTKFTAQAFAGEKPVRLPASAFTASAGDASVELKAGTTDTFTGKAATTGLVDGVKVVVGSATCFGKVQVYGNPTGAFRAVVVDSLSNLPMEGIKVTLDGSTTVKTTDASGVAEWTTGEKGTAAAPFTATAFGADIGYVTVAGTSSNDLLVPVQRNPLAVQGGVKGKLKNLFTDTSDVHVGIVGMSLAGGITDISFDLLLGPSEPTNITLGSRTFSDVPLPSGIMAGLSSSRFKESYKALGRAGFCASDLPKSKLGTCGIRSVWGLGGDVPIAKLSTVIDQVSGGSVANLNIGPILTELLPVFRNFRSTMVRDQQFTLGAPVADKVADAFLAPLDLDNELKDKGGGAVRLSVKTVVKIPTLPKLAGQFVDGAIVLAGSDVTGRGIVPLGLSAGVDKSTTTETADGTVKDEDGKSGQLVLHMAPAHDGAEGSPYLIGVLAASFSNISGGLSASGILHRPSGCASGSSSGLCYGGTIDTGKTFMGYPEGSKFDFSNRRFTVGAGVSGATMYRLIISADAGRWSVYFSGNNGFTLPAAPAGMTDRAAARAEYTLQALDTGSVTFDTLATFNGTNLGEVDQYMNRFVVKATALPTIKITSPAANASVAVGSSVNVEIAAHEAKTWALCVTGAATPVTSIQGCTVGGAVGTDGKSVATVPTGSTGAKVLHAVLTEGGAPLNPAIEATLAVTIQ